MSNFNCQCQGQDADCVDCEGTGHIYRAEEILRNAQLREQIKAQVAAITAKFSPEANRSLSDLPEITPSKRRDTKWL